MKLGAVLLAAGVCAGVVGAQVRGGRLAGVDPSPAEQMECSVCHRLGDSQGFAAVRQPRPGASRFFELYDSASMDNKAEPLVAPADGSLNPKDPAFASLVCLGCHDGAIASARGPRFTSPGARRVSGSSLLDDHPINMSQDPSRDLGLHSPASVAAAGIKLYGPRDTVQCASCHDPHLHRRDGLPSRESMLRVSLFQSQLCLACHQ